MRSFPVKADLFQMVSSFYQVLADDIGWAQPDKIEFGKYGAAA